MSLNSVKHSVYYSARCTDCTVHWQLRNTLRPGHSTLTGVMCLARRPSVAVSWAFFADSPWRYICWQTVLLCVFVTFTVEHFRALSFLTIGFIPDLSKKKKRLSFSLLDPNDSHYIPVNDVCAPWESCLNTTREQDQQDPQTDSSVSVIGLQLSYLH